MELLAVSNLRSVETDRLQSLAKSFLESRSPLTMKAYAQDLEHFSRFIEATGYQAGCAQFIALKHGEANELALKYRTHLKNKGFAPTPINRRLAALRSLVSYGNTIGLINWHLQVRNERIETFRHCTQALDLPSFRALFPFDAVADAPLLRALDALSNGLPRARLVPFDSLSLAQGIRHAGRESGLP